MRFLILLICLIVIGDVGAQIDTDRPNFTSSPNVVPNGAFQVETGYFMDAYDQSICKGYQEFRSGSLNVTGLRYGLTDQSELRLGFNYSRFKMLEVDRDIIYARPRSCTDSVLVYKPRGGDTTITENGWSPMYVGLKTSLWRSDKFSVGLISQLYLPFTATGSYKPRHYGFDVQLPFSWYATEQITLSAQTAMAWNGNTTATTTTGSLALWYAVYDPLSVYVEGVLQLNEGSREGHNVNIGFIFLVNDALQLDLIGGVGNDPMRLNQSGGGRFMSAGICYLWSRSNRVE